MAITKIGSEFVKTAELVGPTVGAYRASQLTDADRVKLKTHYGLEDDASLGWRNAGRGAAGAFAGSLGGSAVGGALGSLVGLAVRKRINPSLPVAVGAQLGSLAGYIAGINKATQKYSKGNTEVLG